MEPGQVTEAALKEYSRATKMVHVANLSFDRTESWGQIRPICEERVKELLAVLSKSNPTVPISNLLLRQLGTGV
jgi:hypothetical protein